MPKHIKVWFKAQTYSWPNTYGRTDSDLESHAPEEAPQEAPQET